MRARLLGRGALAGIVVAGSVLGGAPPGLAQATKARIKANARAKAGGEPELSFSRDIAPILAGNCTGCHGGEEPKGEFDLTTFQKLMAGSEGGEKKVIVPFQPDDSPLVVLLRQGKMPRGNRKLAPEAVAKVERWVKAGARLDAGIDPAAELKTIIPSPEALRRAELARMSPEQRDERAEALARERWAKVRPDAPPDRASGGHFLVFGTLPRARIEHALKTLEAESSYLRGLLGDVPALSGPEKISIYVFKDVNDYVEFVRSVESREVEDGQQAHANLSAEAPYLAVADPLGGGEDESLSRKKSSRSRRDRDETPAGPERSLDGLLAEQLAIGAVAGAGQPPAWLRLGLGAYLGALVEPRSPYSRDLRAEAARVAQAADWSGRLGQVLGGEAAPDRLRAVGFSLVEWLASAARPVFPGFVRGLTRDPRKFDDLIHAGWGPDVDRNQFLAAWHTWALARPSRSR